jgi:mono/diheme cytochrome c family protein
MALAPVASIMTPLARGLDVDSAPDGRVLFETHCASCHGRAATGDGPAAAALRRRPPDLTGMALANGNVFPAERLRRIVDGREVEAHGNRDMPVWGVTFKTTGQGSSEATARARIDAIVEYLASIQRRRG